ncbi:bifunctional riboflavin kinase/FAD synthetase [Haliovirga abyssi]|uniref:Riboflavin biosynthesis protein n=1 Tax=Haliovirga abyssi TaxID=2996794 RepID=A0AAU9DZ33_9FUSO|nr:bifunctional riboflavin kinase/FAD synthetase [Haliovirga abyssi]BDU50750.1 riboflavin biosynthesis protein [Haliovirga abyssi]
MKVIYGIENIDEKFKNPCVALGTFDGIHLGHQSVIKSAIDKAKELNGTSILFTFSPHPLKVITSSAGPKMINSKDEKEFLLEKLGVDILIFANFTVEFSDLHPEKFMKNVLKDILDVKEIFVGFNYTFGKDAIGTTDYMKELSEKYDIKLNVVEPMKIEDEIVSSTLIREYIKNGDLKKAEKLLGYPVMISGKIVQGKKIGRKLGFPTANLKIVNKAYPPYGVYGVKIIFDSEKDKSYYGIMNIGKNPTLKPGEHSIEVNIFDFDKNVYGEKIIIELMKFIRYEKKFETVENLIKEIKNDIKIWKEWLECH